MRPDCPYHACLDQREILERQFGASLPDDLPLFPDQSGQPMDKAAIVEALEATVSLYGEAIQSAAGLRLFGGHSFRVTCAQRLASLGVELIKIMVLARWAGDTILRYVREAPLSNLADEVLALEGKRDVVKLISKFADGAEALSGRIDELESQLTRVAAERAATVAKLERVKASSRRDKFVANGAPSAKNFRVHLILLDGMDVPPQMWRTKCGFRFAFGAFTRHSCLDGFAEESRCKSCNLGTQTAGGERSRATDENSSESTNSSSSS